MQTVKSDIQPLFNKLLAEWDEILQSARAKDVFSGAYLFHEK